MNPNDVDIFGYSLGGSVSEMMNPRPKREPLTEAQLANIAMSLAPVAASAEIAGEFPAFPERGVTTAEMLVGERAPSLEELLKEREFLEAGLLGLGGIGDVLSAVPAVGPVLGSVAKTPLMLSKILKAGENISEAAERTKRKAEMNPEDPEAYAEFLTVKKVQEQQPSGIASLGGEPATPNVPEDVPLVRFEGDSAPSELAEGTARTFQTTGKYRGAPAGTTSPQKLASIQKKLRNYAEKGADFRMWYENTNEWAKSQTGGRPGRLDQYAATAAITSQGASVPANAVMAMKGFNQALVGDPVKAGRFPASQGPAIERIFEGDSPALGPKREPFYQAIVQDPDRLRQTNDIRQARAFGYKNADGSTFDGGLSDAQHRFMDEETDKLVEFARKNKLGGYDDWNRDRVQAAIWIAQKAEEEGSTIADAGKMFQDFTPQATIRTEAAPSESLQHLGGIFDDPEVLAQYSAAQEELMMTPLGQDFITAQAGAMSNPVYKAPGIYEGRSNPGVGIDISVGKSPDTIVDPVTGKGVEASVMDPSSRKLIESIAALQGLIRAQDTVGYTAIVKAPNAATRNALKVDLGRTVSRDEIIKLEEDINKQFGAGKLIPLHAEDGFSVITLDDDALKSLTAGTAPKKTPSWQKDLTKLVDDSFPGSNKEFGLNTGTLVGDTENWTYTPSKYLPPLENVGDEFKNLLDTGAKKISPQLEKLDSELVEFYPAAGDRNKIVSLVRKALAKNGVAGVRELVDKGLVPAVVLGLVLGGASQLPAIPGQPSEPA